jgi:S-DNA-T family DNA segregation ATPase FtsK/SpoIIIE
MAYLSDVLRTALQRRLCECGGLALIALAALAAIALASWSVQDPSLSHATNAPVRNLLGAPGAIAADLMIQLVGLGSLALLLPIAIWGWRLLFHRPLGNEGRRVVYWVIATALMAAFASCLPRTANWPLPTGLGGVVGDAVLYLPLAILGPLSGINRIGLAGLFGMAAFYTFAVAAGLGGRAQDEEEDDETDRDAASVSLGRIAHGLLSIKARVMRLINHRQSTRRLPPAAAASAARQRLEPSFDGSARTTPEAEIDADVEEEEEDEAPPRPARKARSARATRRSGSGYALPSPNLLAAPRASDRFHLSAEAIADNATALESVLSDFGGSSPRPASNHRA